MQHNNFKKDIDLLSEAYDQVGLDKSEDAEGGVVYMVMGEADYEAPDIRGIYSDKEAAIEAAKGLEGELPRDFDIGVVEIQLNTPLDFDTKRKYVEYDSGEVIDPREDKSEHIGSARA